jgi:hypothetical protein
MLDKRKHFMIDSSIQDMLFKLQKKFVVNSEGAVIRRAIVEMYYREIKK